MYDELIKRLRVYSEAVVAFKLDADFAAAVTEAASVIEMLSDHLRDVPKKVPRWIPVTERLPEESGQYLICATENGITHISMAKYWRHFYLTGRMAYWKITHWMPLPEPPKEEV